MHMHTRSHYTHAHAQAHTRARARRTRTYRTTCYKRHLQSSRTSQDALVMFVVNLRAESLLEFPVLLLGVSDCFYVGIFTETTVLVQT